MKNSAESATGVCDGLGCCLRQYHRGPNFHGVIFADVIVIVAIVTFVSVVFGMKYTLTLINQHCQHDIRRLLPNFVLSFFSDNKKIRNMGRLVDCCLIDRSIDLLQMWPV